MQDQYGRPPFPAANFLQGTISTYTYAPQAATPLSWRTLEGAFFVEDTIKLKPSLELRLGFRGESTTGWNEAHGRAANYDFRSNDTSSCPRRARGSRCSLAIPPTPSTTPRSFRRLAWESPGRPLAQEDGDSRGLRHLLCFAGQSELSPRSERAVQHRYTHRVRNVARFHAYAPAANYAEADNDLSPSGVQPESATPAVDLIHFEDRTADRAEHHSERRLRRIARLSRNSFRSTRTSRSGDLPGVALPCRVPRGRVLQSSTGAPWRIPM